MKKLAPYLEEAITIKLAMASKEAKAEEKSDGKQVKGPS